MELELHRTYFPNGTNGVLRQAKHNKGGIICYTIELPWLDNQHGVSCIPEGKYELVKRCSQKFGEHLLLKEVPGRNLILVHPANNAVKELRGCIAPVSICTGEGKGNSSRAAFKKLQAIVYPELAKGNKIFLIIQS